jgi:glycosyltransferase involved in cell wall biosynthesis
MKVCVLLPAYNEAGTIAALVQDIRKHVRDVIVVDDGSSDGTAAFAGKAGAKVLRNEKNAGKGASLRKGFEYIAAGGCGAVITMDADRQHDAGEIPSFIRKMEETGADIVLGTRMGAHEGMPRLRLLTNIVTSFIVSLLCMRKVTDSQTGYRLIRTEVLRNVELETANYETESEIIIKAARKGFAITEVPIKTIYAGQESKIKPGRDTLRFAKLVIRSVLRNGQV